MLIRTCRYGRPVRATGEELVQHDQQLPDIGGGRHYISDTPSERFPIYTRGNAGEVYPEAYYPLSWSIMDEENVDAFEAASQRSGVMTAADYDEDAAVSAGVFAGYAYLNLSLSRVGAARMPGASVDDVDRSFLGTADLPPYVAQKGDRNWRASLRALRYTWRTIRTTELPELEHDKALVADWLRSLPDPATATDNELRQVMEASGEVILPLFETHLVISGQSALAQGVLAAVCRDALDDESLVLPLTSGLGDVESAAPSLALWDLGAMVAADEALGALFDAGVDDDLVERVLRRPTIGPAFARFLAEHGCRGPNEWETACPTWGTKPTMALTLIDRMRGADPSHAPADAARRLRHEREAVTVAARGRLNRLQRWVFDRSLRSTQLFSVGRERTKTTVVRAIHGLRLLSHELARRVAERSGGADDDLWFVLASELDDYLAEPRDYAALIAQRRATRDHLSTLEPPFVFEGGIPPIDQWPPRHRDAVATVSAGDELAGIAGCAGVARGRACVVVDPTQPGDLGPGDVLVAPLTDPSWTPLFVPAEAVIVDVGAQMSHAVIVSRELGLPCVVSVTNATRRIPHGAIIEVDGDAGLVRVIELPTEPKLEEPTP